MKTFRLDAVTWTTETDGWNALAMLLGFPAWHGRNVNALIDSIEPGQINDIEAPYALEIVNTSLANQTVRDFLSMMSYAFARAQERGSLATLKLIP